MKTLTEIDMIMKTIPAEWRERWCTAKLCGCMGCVQIGNRIVMYEEVTQSKFSGDPEYINVYEIPVNIYQKYRISKDEWVLWMNNDQT